MSTKNRSDSKQPLFIHSSFRTSSTWLFERFRRLSETIAFCEPFNEALGHLTLEEARKIGPATWASRHPGNEGYFSEMFPLFSSDRGVSGFHVEFAYDRFVPEDGLDGTLDEEQIQYVNKVLDLGWSAGKIPVFASTRSLGPLMALRRAYGGSHIFIYRNLYEQWMSYLTQHQEGNGYFVQTVARTLNANLHLPVFRQLVDKYWRGPDVDAPYAGFETVENAFCAFLGLHTFLYLNASRTADLVVNTTKLCEDPSYREHVIDRMEALSGLKVDLSDARRQVNYIAFEVSAESVSEIRDLVFRACEPWLTHDASTFGDKLLEEFLADAVQAKIFAEPVYARLRSELKRLNERISLLQQDPEYEHTELLRIHAEIDAIRASSSWKITAPFRKAITFARRFRHRIDG